MKTATGCFRDGRAGFSMLPLVGCRLRNPVWYIFVKTHNWGLGGRGYFRYHANDFCCSFLIFYLSLFCTFRELWSYVCLYSSTFCRCFYNLVNTTSGNESNFVGFILQIACGIVAFLRKNFGSCHVYTHLLFIWYLMHYPTQSLWYGWCLKIYWC